MALTLADLIDDAEHAARNSIDARSRVVDTINDAGRLLFAMHSWNWRMRPPAAIDFVASQEYCDLPSDFGDGELLSVSTADSVTYGAQPTTLREIVQLRETSATSIHSYYWALAYPTQASQTAAPAQPRLEIYPTPSANETGALEVVYRSGWVTLSANTHVANVPGFMERVLRSLVRERVKEQVGNGYGLVANLMNSPEMQALKRADGASQSAFGEMRGGQLSQPAGFAHYNWNFTTATP